MATVVFAETTANPELSLGLVVDSIMMTDMFRDADPFISAVVEVYAVMVRSSRYV
jgi:hypothetical protein